jgi:hypothetical protein
VGNTDQWSTGCHLLLRKLGDLQTVEEGWVKVIFVLAAGVDEPPLLESESFSRAKAAK